MLVISSFLCMPCVTCDVKTPLTSLQSHTSITHTLSLHIYSQSCLQRHTFNLYYDIIYILLLQLTRIITTPVYIIMATMRVGVILPPKWGFTGAHHIHSTHTHYTLTPYKCINCTHARLHCGGGVEILISYTYYVQCKVYV